MYRPKSNSSSQEELLLEKIFLAYYSCRKNKRYKNSQIRFELKYEKKLFELYDKIRKRKYKISSYICFVVQKPIIREVFAASFLDRVVHHLVFYELESTFEEIFIENSFSCRKGKGTLAGVLKTYEALQECNQKSWLLKLDIENYFYSIDRKVLFDMVCKYIKEHSIYLELSTELLEYLLSNIIFKDPTHKVKKLGDSSEWASLPRRKSLFYAKEGCGLPIGNLTSQLFSNIYMNEFDHMMNNDKKIDFYARYVDDFVIISKDKEYLKSLIQTLNLYLQKNLNLRVHPKKVYFQHYTKGLKFLGVFIKRDARYIDKRTKKNLYSFVYDIKKRFDSKDIDLNFLEEVRCVLNSYFGMISHHSSYKMRCKLLSLLGSEFFRYFDISKKKNKFTLKKTNDKLQ
ncbi:MAG: Unknown protein [uncultured Campylobacterales bacterium]|uniref:Reverse transcriptase domain-containing protein n=1 Tax=uncultured Campylobacterales bacterium TaxID=352960 RepID=A0A6S6SLT5_9BACT|nr:MAG: Unknown protein [uncultured Campylobacterales bacterium]